MPVRPKSSTPIWTQPAPGSRRPRYTREQLAAVALEIADREGFEAVSMRRVAEVLGAATMTLYHYVRTKEDLVALMDDALMAELLVPDEVLRAGWREALATIARKTRDTFARHPWALVATRGARSGPNTMRHVEQSLAALDDAPLDEDGKLALLTIVDDFVLGHALRAAHPWRVPDEGEPEGRASMAFVRELLDSGELPRLRAMCDKRPSSEGMPWARLQRDVLFERGLAAILASAEAPVPGPDAGAAQARSRPRAARKPR